MLRHQHRDVQLAGHAHPQAQHLVGHHVAPVKALHQRDVLSEVRDRLLGLGAGGHGHPEVAGEQDAADRVVELEVALRVHEVRGQQPQVMPTDAQFAAGIGHANHSVLGLADFGEMGRETLPDARDHELGPGRRHPAVQRGNDVGVGVRDQQVAEFAGREVLRHAQEQLVEGQVASGVEDGARAIVDDQELIGLHRLPPFLDEVGEHEAGVIRITVEFNRHADSQLD